ncbi:DUF423 domain-containing protein [Eudoraea sp.]|uniref:DUF423 domain-containing protein n=1 Tax=Eudoraea sp. TaxID=1979955 RepID=UPI003C78771D
MNKTIFCTGVFFGVLAVVLGAFGAHGLENLLSSDAIASFKTGVTYQMYHALLLLILGSVKSIPEEEKKLVYYFIVSGIVFFSFSIYLLATNSLTGFDFLTIGFITPIGGLLLILGWLQLGYRAYRKF